MQPKHSVLDLAVTLAVGFLLALIAINFVDIQFVKVLDIGDVFSTLLTVALAIIVSKLWRDAQFAQDSLRSDICSILSEMRADIAVIRTTFVSGAQVGQLTAEAHASLVDAFRNLSNYLAEIEVLRGPGAAKITGETLGQIIGLKACVTRFTPSVQPDSSAIATFDVVAARLRRAIADLKVKIYKGK